MQPYIFPYVGYFQLLRSVDKFIVYDDVNYIKQGWVSRNRILVNNGPAYFTIPLINSSSFKMINETMIHPELYGRWSKKFYSTLVHSYKKAPFFEPVYELVLKTFENDSKSISQLAIKSIEVTLDYLGLEIELSKSSTSYKNSNLHSQERVISICELEKADTYINVLGGQSLYSKKDFLRHNIRLQFLKPNIPNYSQFEIDFVPGLSIIDLLMFNSKEKVISMFESYELV